MKRSSCCQQNMRVSQSVEGTCCYICENCNNACDEMSGPTDLVNSPTHYTDGGMETIEIIKAKSSQEEYSGFLKGNVIKYVTRAGKKGNKKEDLRKAQWYLSKLIEEVNE